MLKDWGRAALYIISHFIRQPCIDEIILMIEAFMLEFIYLMRAYYTYQHYLMMTDELHLS